MSEERTRMPKKYWVDQAIDLAMKQRWEEAINTNRIILDTFPTDVEAHNRLGKALTELGRYGEAIDTYKRAADLDPNNSIARKNIQRLSALNIQEAMHENVQAQPRIEERVDPRLFIEEIGKTEVTRLLKLAPAEVLARMTAGDQVYLNPAGRIIEIRNARGETLGQLDARLSQRMIALMEGGNKYTAAITALNEHEVRVILREMYQHPSQSGKVSFPPKLSSGLRPYMREGTMLMDEEEDEDFGDESELGDDTDFEEGDEAEDRDADDDDDDEE